MWTAQNDVSVAICVHVHGTVISTQTDDAMQTCCDISVTSNQYDLLVKQTLSTGTVQEQSSILYIPSQFSDLMHEETSSIIHFVNFPFQL